ncbi:Arm DNA-binding domain-containing protein [Streptomyces sp. MS1.HAVA.3]|uniref:Arm DNA-binding domain-containing protein n=1 Tax=Streptomyces caledonius TaxID=3134107 RepID=A0ABU8U6U6_9ACTN
MKGSTYKRCKCPAAYDAKGNRRNCRKDHGAWYYVADVGFGPDGKRKQARKGGFRTADDAEKALAKLLGRVNEGSYTQDDGQTVAAWLETWMELKRRAGLRPSTIRAYRSHIDEYLTPHLGRLRLRDLRPSHVDQLLAALDNGKRKAATVRRIHATLRSALSTAVRRRMITFNAAKDVDLPASQRPNVKPWEPAELGQFLDSIGTHRLGAMFEVVAGTGLRRGEAVGLRWDDIDLASRVIVVRQQIVQESGRKKNKQEPAACPYCEAGHLGVSFGKPKTASGRTASSTLTRSRSAHSSLTSCGRTRSVGRGARHTPITVSCSPVRTASPCGPTTSRSCSAPWSRRPAYAVSGFTTCGTVRHPSCSLPASTWRSCRSVSGTRPSPSRRTLTRTCSAASDGTLRTAHRHSYRAPAAPRRRHRPTTCVTTW